MDNKYTNPIRRYCPFCGKPLDERDTTDSSFLICTWCNAHVRLPRVVPMMVIMPKEVIEKLEPEPLSSWELRVACIQLE